MSYPVNVSVHVDGGSALTDYNKLTLNQHVLTHHSFALDFSFEALSKALGLKPDTLFAQAHEKLIGKNITIGWTGSVPADAGRAFEFKGIVTNISIQTDADLVNYYHISGYSPTFLLEDGTQSRTFVKKSLQAIFTQVLGDYPANPLQKQLQAQSQDVLPYNVQYNETNFNFLSRMAAAQGEWFYYDGTTLNLGRGAGKTIPFRSNSAQVFTLSMHLQPGKTEGAHYNYRTHEPLKSKATAPTAGHPFSQFAVQKSDELFTQPHRLQAGAQMNDQSQLQRSLDGLAAKRAGNQVSLEGSGEAFDTAPGCVLDVQDAAGAAYGKFRVLAVRHEVDGDGKGQMFTPEEGSQVLVGYEHGLAEFPVALGNLFHPSNKQSKLYSPPSNNLKGMQTAGGNKFVMSEGAGAQSILLSNSNKKDTAVLVSFKGDGSIDIKTNGPINLTAGKDITLQAGKSITLQADENIMLIAKKRVSVDALEEDVAIRAQKAAQLTAVSGDLTLDATAKKAVVKAADNVEVTATGQVKLNGSDVKLNG